MEEVKYIPGDLVNPNGSIVKVISITLALENNIELGFSNGWHYTADCRDFDDEALGVPLTPEILENNGWIKFTENEDLILYKHPTSRSISIEIPKQRRAKVSYIYDECLIVFHYVHQLQHLLFGLGLSMDLKV